MATTVPKILPIDFRFTGCSWYSAISLLAPVDQALNWALPASHDPDGLLLRRLKEYQCDQFFAQASASDALDWLAGLRAAVRRNDQIMIGVMIAVLDQAH